MPTWLGLVASATAATTAVLVGTGCRSAVRRLHDATRPPRHPAMAGRVQWRPVSPGRPRRGRRPAAGGTSQLSLFVDLVAAALAAGGSVHESLVAVSRAMPGDIADQLLPICSALSLGSTPEAAWAPLRADPVLRPLALTLTRAATSGTPAAVILAELAVDLRARRRVAATEAARSAGVRAVAPLGLCFLPAFVLVGVVPTVVGLATAALHGG